MTRPRALLLALAALCCGTGPATPQALTGVNECTRAGDFAAVRACIDRALSPGLQPVPPSPLPPITPERPHASRPARALPAGPAGDWLAPDDAAQTSASERVIDLTGEPETAGPASRAARPDPLDTAPAEPLPRR
ncbi:hypothetical protein QA634_12235 [Methylobacterium sp. CB376]|uniref:hypothetical protein n=1 Tax=Methylobacterium sp. CB376 TaxID=3138063 RepID=UPI0024B268F2|nr:hypothetical protein [Methylobacterium nodulans]WFT82563.1 hypothetical protein QA634_12235 [Methylobacterium nodulans]